MYLLDLAPKGRFHYNHFDKSKGVQMKIRFIPLLLLAIALLFTSCSRRQEAAATGTSATELRYGFTTEPATLDPLNPANTADGRSILFNVFEGLVKPDTAGHLLPCAAESWTIEQNALVYNFTLREGVRFHDGSILNANDVKFSLETAVTAKFAGFTQIAQIETPNENSVRITLKNPDPEFLPYLTIGIVKAGNADREKNINGTGPYRIESYTAQQSLALKKFENYWQKGLPHFEKITIVFLADSDALLLALKGGSIDGASITGSIARQLADSEFDIVPGYSAAVHVMALNNAVKPLDDIRIRQAINYAVDLQGIIDTAFYGFGSLSGSPLIPGLAEYYDTSLVNPYPLDLERARSLLAEAGYGGSNTLKFEITVPANYTMHVDTAQVIVSQLAKAGIDVSIKQVDWATWLSEVYQGRKYQATIISVDAQNVSPRSFLSRYLSDAGSNFMNFNSPEFDRVYDAALRETDAPRRAELYKEAQRIISANAAGVYIQDIYYFKAFRRGFCGGVLFYPVFVIDFAAMYGL
jgi:peptide/nickel transport system substrate-binding protein